MRDGSAAQILGAPQPDGQQFISGRRAAASLHTFKPFPQRLNHRQRHRFASLARQRLRQIARFAVLDVQRHGVPDQLVAK